MWAAPLAQAFSIRTGPESPVWTWMSSHRQPQPVQTRLLDLNVGPHPPSSRGHEFEMRAMAASSSSVEESPSGPMRWILPFPIFAIRLISSGSADRWLMQMQEMLIPLRATLAACLRAYFWGDGWGAVA